MKPLSYYRRPLVAATVVGVLCASAGLYSHHRLIEKTAIPLSNQAIVGKWRGAVSLPTGGASHRHYADFPLDLTFRPDGTVVSESFGHMEARYSVHGKSVTYSRIRYRGKNRPQRTEQQASIVGDTLTLINRDKSVVALQRD